MRAVIVQNLQRLAPRERLFLAAGGLALLLFFLLIAAPSQGSGEAVELAQPQTAPPPAYFPPPAPVVTPPQPAAAPTASPAGLTLRSVLATGAIFAFQGGAERLVPIGREFLPGLTLKEVGLSHATVASSGGDLRFELGRAGGAAAAVLGGSAAAFPAAGETPAVGGQRETMAYRLGLQPVAAKGRVGGYAIRPEADLPALRQAGLQPGDVIVGVNGGGFDEERLMELSWSIANSSRTEFEFIRNGRRMKGTIAGRR
jgi:general secretion pathway protein C